VVPPVIKLKGTETMYVIVNEKFQDPGFTASDDCDGDITNAVTVEGKVDTGKVGTYKLTYKVKDSYNNEVTATRTVQVANKATVDANTGSTGTGEKIVYLTFDDGPGKYTEKLLNILDKYGVKVTFFVTNQFPSYQHLIGEASRRGHTIAIHTYSHDYATIYKSENAYFNDLNKMKDVIIAQTGKTPKIVRFPGGTNNTISRKYCSGIMTALSNSLLSNGYVYSDWNVDSNDAGGATSSSQVASNVIAGIKKKSVSNVLMHDIKGYTVDAIDQIVSWGLANGYQFKAMTPSSPMFCFRPNN
jgi:peptidoglycan/xylan/chitin deacetylase (PgdA/CDA1 family)